MKPLVTVVIPTCNDSNDGILRTCVKSIQQSVDVDTEIIIVSSRDKHPEQTPGTVVGWMPKGTKLTKANNEGLRFVRPESDFIVLANDDTIFSKTALIQMAMYCRCAPMLLNPLSNCDNMWRFAGDFGITKGNGEYLVNKRFYGIDEVSGYEDAIMSVPPGHNIAIQVDYLPMYATMMSRRTFEITGYFDEEYELTYDDNDYCLRAKMKGVNCFSHLGAFVFHYGGISSETTPDKEGKRQRSREHFRAKWGNDIARDNGIYT